MLIRYRLPVFCLRPIVRSIRTQTLHEQTLNDQSDTPYPRPPGLGLATPRELMEYLNQFIVGQETAKKVLSVAVYNHYNRVRANMSHMFDTTEDTIMGENGDISAARLRPLRNSHSSLLSRRHSPVFEKSNVLVIGPTGSGKTLLARTLAKVLDVPFSVSDANSFTQAGYVGEDVDMAIQRLLQSANWDPVRASMGIVYIDEVDKIARKSGSATEMSRDVGGEGVQQALLRMMEGATVTVQAKGAPPSDMTPFTEVASGQRPPHAVNHKPDVYHIETSNILFILSGAFVGLDVIIKQRVAKGQSIGFTADVPNSQEPPLFFTPNGKESNNILDLVETSDLVKYGFIPEFISRMPSVTTLSPLTISDLRRILTEVKGSLISQYQSLFGYSGVEIRFTNGALEEICKKASEHGGGARGLRGIMESLLLEPMYEAPGSDIKHVLITDQVVRGEAPPGYWRRGEGVAFFEAWANAEGMNTL
ncbi:P-loop containing nucleoside triphosphate hydrolase protein [Amanita rubescens]|nr:P-loop containing nucleoside triphosphate hydrolase protein [Amanita rubescens]